MLTAQKTNWPLYPNRVDFSPGGPMFSPLNFTNPSSSLQTPYVAENAVFDGEEVLFYVQNGTVYDGDGQSLGTIADPGLMKKEIAIAPVPGTCATYCIFILETFPSTELVFSFAELEFGPGGGSYLNGPILVEEYLGTNQGGLAVSPIIPGTEAERYVYVSAHLPEGRVDRYRMTAQGVVFETTVANFPSGNGFESELELSPNGKLLAWSDSEMVFVEDLGNAVQYSLNTGPGFDSYCTGLEFSPDGEFLFISHFQQGLLRWNFDGVNPPLNLPNTSKTFNLTHLEAGLDGRIYCVRNGGLLSAIDPASLTIDVFEWPVFSNLFGGATPDNYALPDQIDGEGDAFFYGVEPLAVNGLSINEQTIHPTISEPVPAFYNCGPIELNVDYDGAATGYSIEINSVDEQTGEPVFGIPYLDYDISFTGPPIGPIDLRCLADAVNCDLFDGFFGQTFRVKVIIANRCEEVSAQGYFQVFDAPSSPADINMQIFAGTGPGTCSPSQDIANPCTVTTYAGGFDLSNSNGDITFFQVSISEVDCNSGQEIELLYDGPVMSTTSVSQLIFVFNGFEIDGSFGYFTENNFDGRCIRVTAEVGNNCGSETDFSYVQFDDNNFNDPDPGKNFSFTEKGENTFPGVAAFPNPVHSACRLGVTLAGEETVHVLWFDQQGRRISEQRAALAGGYNELVFDLSGYTPGAYLYRVVTADGAWSGKVIKL